MLAVELLLGSLLAWSPPEDEDEFDLDQVGVEEDAPAESDELEESGDPEASDEIEESGDPEASDELGSEQPEPGEEPPSPVDKIVQEAVQAAKDRAWLERNNQEIDEYVHQLDQLGSVEDELDTCARAIQAEIRMDLALAYLREDGTCSEAEDEDADEDADAGEPAEEAPPLPQHECGDLSSPSECADRLLERVAEFADEGPGGTPAPLSQAFGCPHALEQMSVEQLFGACLSEQYDEAVERWQEQRDGGGRKERGQLNVPRWASIVGISGGAALLVTGAVLIGIDGNCPGGYDPMSEAGECPNVYNTDAGGAVLVSVGGLAMVGMGVVLAITEVQRKKSRESTAMRRVRRFEAATGMRLVPRLDLRGRSF